MAWPVRLLVCLDCKTLEEVPDYQGPPEGDVLLEMVASRHEGPRPVEGSKVTDRLPHDHGQRHIGNMMVIDPKDWADETKRKEILRQAGKEVTGLDQDFYDTRNTFIEDAGKCFNAHQRPKDFCIDWHNESKRLSDPMKNPQAPKVYLCDFCVVSSRVNTKKAESGLWTP